MCVREMLDATELQAEDALMRAGFDARREALSRPDIPLWKGIDRIKELARARAHSERVEIAANVLATVGDVRRSLMKSGPTWETTYHLMLLTPYITLIMAATGERQIRASARGTEIKRKRERDKEFASAVLAKLANTSNGVSRDALIGALGREFNLKHDAARKAFRRGRRFAE